MRKISYILIFICSLFVFNFNVNAWFLGTSCSNDEQLVNVKYSTSKQFNIKCIDLKNLYQNFIDKSGYDSSVFKYIHPGYSMSYINNSWLYYFEILFFTEPQVSYHADYVNGINAYGANGINRYRYYDLGTISGYSYNYDKVYNSLILEKTNGVTNYSSSMPLIPIDDYFTKPSKVKVNIYNNLNDDVLVKELDFGSDLSQAFVDTDLDSYIGFKYNGSYFDVDFKNKVSLPYIVNEDIDIYLKYELIDKNEYIDLNEFDFYTYDTNYDYLVITYDNDNYNYFGSKYYTNSFEFHYYNEDKVLVDVCLSPSYHFGDYYYYNISRKFNGSVMILSKAQLEVELKNYFDWKNFKWYEGGTVQYYDFYLSKGAKLTYTNDLSSITIPVYNEDTGNYEDTDVDMNNHHSAGNPNYVESNNGDEYFDKLVTDNSFLNTFSVIGNSISIIYYNLSDTLQSYVFYSFMLGISLVLLKVML